MQSIERGGYSREEILDVLHSKGNARNVRFSYDLLDKNENIKKKLNSVVSGEVSMSAFSTIKRTAKFTLKEKVYPERFEDQPDETNKLWNTTTSWDRGTYPSDRLLASANSLIFKVNGTSLAPTWNMEGGTNGIATGWETWGGTTRTTYAQSTTGGISGWGQRLIRNEAGASGIQTTNKALINAVAGNIIYVSFFFKPSNSNFTDPNYCYLLSGTGGVNNVALTGYTLTDVGNGWFRFDASHTWSGTTANIGLLIGWNNGTDGNVWLDNVYFQKGTAPVYSGEWISETFSVANGEAGAVTGSNVYFTNRLTNGSQATYYSRVSRNDGQTWTSWVVQPLNSEIVGLPIGEPLDSTVLVQFKILAQRYETTMTVMYVDSLEVEFSRTMQVYVPEETEINYLQDRIQPFMEIRMRDGGWLRFPLGVFLLSSPTRVDGMNGQVYREIEAYDGLIILDEDKFTSRYRIAAGTKYTVAVQNILTSAGITKSSIEESTRVLGSDLEFPTGTSKLEAVNKLLTALNYTPLWVDANGYFVTYPYVSPTDRASDYTYEDNELSVTYNGMEEELDIYHVPNVWVFTESNPEKTPITAKFSNTNPNSQTSTVSMGRNIVDFREVDDVADEYTLGLYVKRVAHETSQVFGKLKFKTALMPFHEYYDVLRIKYDPLKIDDNFSETSWTMPLEIGGQMEHEARRVVKIV